MKKIFLTTAAALVASGGAFAMEGGVAFTGGEAKFGMQYDEQHTDMEAQFFHDLDFKMGASGTTDDGIGFSANVKTDKDAIADSQVHVIIDNHKLSIGSGLDSASILAGGLGDPGLDGVNADNHAEMMRNKVAKDFVYMGTFGMATVGVSLGDADAAGDEEEWAAGFKFDLAPITVGVGVDSNDVISLGGSYSMGQITAAGFVAMDEDVNEGMNGDQERMGAGVEIGYNLSDETSLLIVAGQDDNENTGQGVKLSSYGAGFSHSLGGGATLTGAIGSYECDLNNEDLDGGGCKATGDALLKADFGIKMTF